MPPNVGDASREELLRLVGQIVRAADVRAAIGIRVIRVWPRQAALDLLVREATRVLENVGFATIRAGTPLSASAREALCHRHVVLFAPGESGEGDVVRWIRDLTHASTRAHLLVIAESAIGVAARGPAATARSAVADKADWHQRTARITRLADDFIDRGELQRAESLLQGICAEATVRREMTDPEVRLRCAQVYFWQGRFEAAASVLTGAGAVDPRLRAWRGLVAWAGGEDVNGLATAESELPSSSDLARTIAAERLLAAGRAREAARLLSWRLAHEDALLFKALRQWLRARCVDQRSAEAVRFVRSYGARGIFRWGLGRRGMNLLHGVTALLQVVHDADDEFHALRQGCAWLRRELGAGASGVAATDGTLVVGDGLGRADLEEADLQASIRTGQGRTIASGPHTVVSSPVRYGGVTIGMAIVRGSSDASETMADAAAAFACACAPALRARLDALSCAGTGEALTPEILGRSPAIAGLRESIARAAATRFPVLVEGESGTGKELVARALHRLSARRDRRFSAINCAALSDELVEAELFGHARGAFTGALNARAGLFEEAHGGTLFLDEVSELSPRAQAKLLRVLQEHEIRRVGEHAARPVDVRVVAAANVPLAEAAARGTFRQDLLFRLAVVRIRIAPLRDRIEDVPMLAQACWRSLIAQTSKRALLGPDAVAALCRHRWPGNVRELQNAVAALVVAAPSRGRVTARHVAQVLAAHGTEPDISASLGAARLAFDRRMIAAALARHGGRQVRAARDLGLSRQGLAKAIKRLGLGYYRPGAEVRAAAHRDDAPGVAGRRHARLFAHSPGAR